MRQDVWKCWICGTEGTQNFISVFQTANAALASRRNDEAVYDTDLDITWLADANYAKTSGISSDGRLCWTDTQRRFASLNSANHPGANNWCLPTTLKPDPTCPVQPTGSPPCGYVCCGGDLSEAAAPLPAAGWRFDSGRLGLFREARCMERETQQQIDVKRHELWSVIRDPGETA